MVRPRGALDDQEAITSGHQVLRSDAKINGSWPNRRLRLNGKGCARRTIAELNRDNAA